MIRRTILILVTLSLAMLVAAPAVAAKSRERVELTETVTGTLPGGVPFTGALSVDRITTDGEQLLAHVSLTGNGINKTKAVVPIEFGGASEVGVQQVACDILMLDIGPIFLDLLGLVLETSLIEIDLTAVPGPGNLLGNLLCAVVGLLDGGLDLGGLINRLIALINQLLG
jgi:hypothetical protein